MDGYNLHLLQPQTIKAVTMVGGGNPGVFGFGADPKDSRKLEASDDGVNFKLFVLFHRELYCSKQLQSLLLLQNIFVLL